MLLIRPSYMVYPPADPADNTGFSPIAGSSSGGEPDWDDAETYAQLIIGGGAAAGSGTGKGEGLVTIAVTDDGSVLPRFHMLRGGASFCRVVLMRRIDLPTLSASSHPPTQPDQTV